MKKPAFLLVQMLIYIALLTLVTVMATRFLGSLLVQQWQWRRSMTQKLQISLGMDVLARDVSAARCEKRWWHLDDCVFRKDSIEADGTVSTVDVGWQRKGETLQRVEGDFDYKQGVWVEKTTSVVVENMSSFAHHLVTNSVGNVVAVEVAYETPAHGERDISVPLLNGREL